MPNDLVSNSPVNDTGTTAQPVPAQQQPTAQQPQPSQQQAVQNDPAAPSLDLTGGQSGPPNLGTPAPAANVHPAIQRASIVHQIAQTLAGGQRYQTTIDPETGTRKQTPIPMSRADIGMAIAMEAISGALGGLATPAGPNVTGRAAAAGFAQAQQQRQQADAQQEQQAQTDANNQASALARKASIFETNSRTLLNTAEAERYGAEGIDSLVSQNRAAGLLETESPFVDNGGEAMTQAELLDAMRSGKVSATDHLGPVAGRVEVTDADGTKRWEATHLVLKSGDAKVPLTQSDADRLKLAGVAGFQNGMTVPEGYQVPLRMKALWTEQANAHNLASFRLSDLRNTLHGTQYASLVPDRVDFSQPGMDSAMQRFQTYISHNAAAAADPYTALQQMGADKRDPKTGEMQPNTDAKYVGTIADAFGGWNVLKAAHDQITANSATAEKYAVIDTQDKAEAVLAAPKRFTPDQRSAAQRFIALQQSQGIGKAVAEARAHAHATGADVEAMFRFGTNPVTGERLTIANAPDAALVTPTGTVVPQNLVSVYKPTAQQRQTADTARQVIAISNDLQQQIAKNPALIGPLAGRDKQGLAKLGLGSGEAQKLIDDVSLLQSATTKMHTGRFSNEILKKSGSLITPGMNQDQFNGAISAIQDVAGRYAQEDQLRTVADWKQQQGQQQTQQPSQGTQQQKPAANPSMRSVQIPAGAQVGRDAHGNVVGYKLNGQYVPLGGQ